MTTNAERCIPVAVLKAHPFYANMGVRCTGCAWKPTAAAHSVDWWPQYLAHLTALAGAAAAAGVRPDIRDVFSDDGVLVGQVNMAIYGKARGIVTQDFDAPEAAATWVEGVWQREHGALPPNVVTLLQECRGWLYGIKLPGVLSPSLARCIDRIDVLLGDQPDAEAR